MDKPTAPSSPAQPSPASSADPDAPKGPNVGQQIWEHSKPLLERAWLYLRVWIPFLATPDFRGRLVKYPSRPYLVDLIWEVKLPKVCTICGREDNLQTREYVRKVRNFETPGTFVGASLGIAAVCFLISIVWFFSTMFFLLGLMSLCGLAVVYVKSWEEEFELTTYCCPDHAENMSCPEVFAFDEKFCVLVGTARVAEDARVEIRNERANRQGGASGAGPAARGPAAGGPKPAAPSSGEAARRAPLPPIKMDD